MSVESFLNQEPAMDYVSWALETGLWDGREIDPGGVNDFKDALIENIAKRLFSQDPDSPEFQKMYTGLAYLGAQGGTKEEIAEELLALQTSQDWVVIPAGLGKSLKKIWKKHKVEILVGIAAVAVVTAVAVGVLCAAGASAGALAAKGEKEKKDRSKAPAPSVPSPQKTDRPNGRICRDPSFIELPPTQISLDQTSVALNGQHLSYCDTLQPQTIAQILYTQGSESFRWKENSPHLQEYIPPLTRIENAFSVPGFLEKAPPPKAQEIPIFSSKNYPPVKNKCDWVREMIDWGLTDSFDGTTPMPLPENAISQVFRTEGVQRKDVVIGGINGINTSLPESINHAEYLAQFSKGLCITWIHNYSNFPPIDLGECLLFNFSGSSPNTKNLEREQWIAFHEANKDNPEAKFLQFCHSQGAIHTKNALQSVPEEIRQRVIVVAIAPAAIIPRGLCYAAYNYASKLDKVNLAEMLAKSTVNIENGRQAMAEHEQLILLDPHEGETGWDHGFESPTFTKKILDHLDEYLQSQGVK